MKIASPNPKKKIIILSIAFAVLIGGGALAYINSPLHNNTETPVGTPGDPSTETPSESPSSTDDPVEDNHLPDPTDNVDRNPDQQPAQSDARINVSYYDAAEDTISASVVINRIWNDGQCVMQVNGPRTQTVRGQVFSQPQSSGCQLSISDLPVGSYTVTIYAERNNQRTNTQTLNINL